MINHANYENWFLLYADGELSEKEQEMVLRFAEHHPQQKKELDLLLQIRFTPDAALGFPGKQALLKNETDQWENEPLFLPDLSITFPDKSSLYKKTNPVRSLWIRSLSAAAGLILVVGLLWLLLPDRDGHVVSGIAVVEVPAKMTQQESKPLTKMTDVPVADQREVGAKTGSLTKTSSRPNGIARKEQPMKAVEPGPGASQNTAAVQKARADKAGIDKMFANRAVNDKASVDNVLANRTENAKLPIDKPETDKTGVEKQTEYAVSAPAPVRSNFTEEALASAREKAAAGALNPEVFIQAALKEERNTPFRGLIRKLSRHVLNDRDEEEDQRLIRVAVFTIPVQKK